MRFQAVCKFNMPPTVTLFIHAQDKAMAKIRAIKDCLFSNLGTPKKVKLKVIE